MKKYFIGVLAALMLFAFTACEPQVATWPTTKDVSYLTIEQVKDFVKGETASKDGFNLIIHYTDNTTEAVPGAVNVEGNYKATSALAFKNGEDAVPAVELIVDFEPVTSVAISGVTSATIDDTVTLDDLKNIVTAITNKKLVIEGTPVITLSYEGGTREFTLDDLEDGEFGVVLSLWKDGKMADASTDFKADETYTVTLDKYQFGTNGWNEIKPAETGLSINVVAAAEDDDPTPVEMGYRIWTYDATAKKAVETDTIWADDALVTGKDKVVKAKDTFIEIYMIDSEGDETPLTVGTAANNVSVWYNTGADDKKGATGMPSSLTFGTTYSVTVRYNDAKAGVKDLSFALSTEDYVTGLTVTSSGVYVAKNSSLSQNDITVQATHAVTANNVADFKGYTIVGGTAPANAVDGQTYTAYVEYVNEKGETLKSNNISITIGTKPATPDGE